MKIERRDWLKLAAGGTAGLLFTPVPWKLLDDVSIWSQNWSWIPRPPRGEEKITYTACTLCPAGCPVRARTIADHPVRLTGVALAPSGYGSLCPLGLAGHQLPYHPGRLKEPLARTTDQGRAGYAKVALDTVVAILKEAARHLSATQSVAVLDERPGRLTSLAYRRFLGQLPHGIYITAPAEGGTPRVLARMLDKPPAALGIDLEFAATILSFGTPVFDGWVAPGRLVPRTKYVIQVEPRESRTAALADQWLPIQPGMEAALALAIGHVLIRDHLHHPGAERAASDFAEYTESVRPFTPETVAEETGVAAGTIRAVAHTLARRGPSIVIGGGDPGGGPFAPDEEIAIAGLNLLLTSVGGRGGFLERRELPTLAGSRQWELAPSRDLADVPDHSVKMLILGDAFSGNALPWPLIERKLAGRDAFVVSLSPYFESYGRHADLLVPSPACLESLQDVPAPFDAVTAGFRLAPPLLKPPPGVTSAVEFVARLGKALGADMTGAESMAELVRAQVEAIHATRRGSVLSYSDGSTKAVTEFAAVADMEKALTDGAVWIDEEAKPAPPGRFRLLGDLSPERLRRAAEGRLSDNGVAGPFPVVVVPYAWRGAVGNGQVAPVLTKLYQESDLRPQANLAAIHPKTGEAAGLTDGGEIVIRTAHGDLRTRAVFDQRVQPGVVEVAVSPPASEFGTVKSAANTSVLDACAVDAASWRLMRANVGRA